MNTTCGERQLVEFRLESQTYAVDVSEVEQILPFAELSAPSGMPKFLLGFLHLQGETIPIIELRTLFGLPALTIDLWTPILLLKTSEPRVGLVVDEVTRVFRCQTSQFVPMPHGRVFNESVTSAITREGRHILVLSSKQLLIEEERAAISAFREMAIQRVQALQGAAS